MPDVNVMFALVNAEHEHARTASTWLARQPGGGSVHVCRVVQMGLLRLLTQRVAMGDRALTPGEAWRLWHRLLTDERFVRVEEPSKIEAEWRRLTEALPNGASVNTDTYLAAFALSGGHTLVTFDGGFDRFSSLKVERLKGD